MSTTDNGSLDLAPARSSGSRVDTHEHSSLLETHEDRSRSASLRENARNRTDDEILGLESGFAGRTEGADLASRDGNSSLSGTAAKDGTQEDDSHSPRDPVHLRSIFKTNPELRQAWHDADSYRESFATPEEARAATAALADLDRMDSLFFSNRAEDHTELARAVAALNPAAFGSLVQAMVKVAGQREGLPAENPPSERPALVPDTSNPSASSVQAPDSGLSRAAHLQAALTPSQEHFFQTTNAEAVQSVLEAIEVQVDRLLPEGTQKGARNRVVGEIYRELDTALRSNKQLSQQVRDAFRSGALDDAHRHAIVTLVTGRARQALPAVAKRVLNEWTSAVVVANQDRRARQHNAERRIDIAGSGQTGSDGRRPLTSQDIDYSRMSDADILNL